MRLIDADEVKKAFIGNRYGTKAIEYVIDNTPTVEAIPKEWIKRYASNKSYNDGMDCYWHFWEEDVLKMVADWEKENEQEASD